MPEGMPLEADELRAISFAKVVGIPGRTNVPSARFIGSLVESVNVKERKGKTVFTGERNEAFGEAQEGKRPRLRFALDDDGVGDTGDRQLERYQEVLERFLPTPTCHSPPSLRGR